MSLVICDYNDLKAIANSIRNRTGESETFSIGELSSSIDGIKSPAIIDVITLPISDVDEKSFYRLPTYNCVCNKNISDNYTCYCVERLPDIGEPVLNTDGVTVSLYYSISDENAYGYVDELLSATMEVSVGWHEADLLLQKMGYTYSGVITSLEEDPCDDALRLLLEYEIYSYKDGKWTSSREYIDVKYNKLSEEITKLKESIMTSTSYDETTGDLNIKTSIYFYDETNGNLTL